ncbi:MAG: hypothetical protein KTR24_07050 [Saprospiraceae bacterium]|nr:hypothetical protein [Saprospiraceae bacterium]
MKERTNWLSHLLNFIAVILGVYLAFYINERATANKEAKESVTLMRSLITDLSDDIATYENYQIPTNLKQLESIEEAVALLTSGQVEAAGEKLSVVFQVENFSPTTSIYSTMKYSGKLRLIQDMRLQKELSDYYEGLVVESIKKGDFQADYFTSELLSWLISNVDILDMKLVKRDDLLTLRNKLVIYGSLVEQKVLAYKSIVEESKDLQSTIEALLGENRE